ncbi:MAG: nucleotidyltransferase domain-containing protein [Phycisphaerae bacterium]
MKTTPKKSAAEVKTQIHRMARRIVKHFSPEQIILFGSQATGRSTPDSDVDLLVVMEVKGSKRDKAVQIGEALHDFPLPKDVIVVRPAEFAWRKKINGTLERPAALEGKVLYAR